MFRGLPAAGGRSSGLAYRFKGRRRQGTPSLILHGLYWLAANVALHQPTLLAIDDLHWADTPPYGGSST